MIITKTSIKLFLFGGGPDCPAHYLKRDGYVLATSIDIYCHISCRELPPFFDHNYRVVYCKIEHAKTVDAIIHPFLKAVLNYLKVNTGP